MRFDLTAEDIGREADELIKKSLAIYDGIGKLSEEEVSYDTVIKVRADSRKWMNAFPQT